MATLPDVVDKPEATDDIDARITAAVAAGVAWLDGQWPGWWRSDVPGPRIDLAHLNMRNPCTCILGQLFGDFDDVNGQLPEDASRLGFDAAAELGLAIVEEYSRLAAEWRRVITARRDEAGQ